jgi:hypothetical protein
MTETSHRRWICDRQELSKEGPRDETRRDEAVRSPLCLFGAIRHDDKSWIALLGFLSGRRWVHRRTVTTGTRRSDLRFSPRSGGNFLRKF